MSKKRDIATTYNPKTFEEKLYNNWQKKGYFTPKAEGNRKTYSMVIPPPNITGKLHLGHALDDTIQDVIIRTKRMQGYNTLWVPGEDHASIATEVKVEKELLKKGILKKKIGREEFLKRTWDWSDEYRERIRNQVKKLDVL